jgi:hypothetical protein
MSRWLQERTTRLLGAYTDRRGFLAKSAVVGSALATNPLQYVLKPTSAYAATCNCRGQPCVCGSACCDGYTDFCCTLTGFNSCPGGTVPAGWWKADGSGFCAGSARYYIDCNVVPGNNPCSCKCALDDCNHRAVCCTQFRYGQCHQELPVVGAIMCRVVTCTPPWVFDPTCTTDVLVDNNTRFHDAACLHDPGTGAGSGIGIYRTANFYLRNSLTTGVADVSVLYGNVSDVPLVGDWNGDGVAGLGVFRAGNWYLRNSLTTGVADRAFGFGNPGDIPVVGDWNGDGKAGIGVFRQGNWYLRNSLSSGPPEYAFGFGNPDDVPVVGDWNGDRVDGVGVFRKGNWYLRNVAADGAADRAFGFGNPDDVPVVGDWNGDGVDGVGVFRKGNWYLRNVAADGAADLAFGYGNPDDLPLTGRWAPTH